MVVGRGFSLVELMVVIAILGILAVVAAPFTASWRQDADVRAAASTLELAFGKARALALRNPAEMFETAAGVRQVASGVKRENAVLLVCEGAPTSANCTAGGSAEVWSGRFPDGVSITVNGGQMTAHGLDNTGQSIGAAGNTAVLRYTISKGAKSYQYEFH